MTASTLTLPVQDAHFQQDHHPKLGVHRPRLKAMQPSELAVHKTQPGKPRSNKSMRRERSAPCAAHATGELVSVSVSTAARSLRMSALPECRRENTPIYQRQFRALVRTARRRVLLG